MCTACSSIPCARFRFAMIEISVSTPFCLQITSREISSAGLLSKNNRNLAHGIEEYTVYLYTVRLKVRLQSA